MKPVWFWNALVGWQMPGTDKQMYVSAVSCGFSLDIQEGGAHHSKGI